ncbi:MATE family efflux transporter [[Clostridium] hylemonae]|uniref:Multidrug export protein MepA n=1 Tax=[Clostridium] hylemonae DSM 15053 TaxID=553973 RepID=C0BZE2_9FIRM|nr:MATE family efflux transporter [[Clostridium] hylemonae]EEG74520.1 MATE efflux family protein [[Clostridium] hylemonae DSM 15053]QEK18553.1 Multidrug export protein MepA [[Clostridium] hylemonae DSM 15053]BDF05555.1 multidrug transporter MatE [[Clostridium] hylemonae]
MQSENAYSQPVTLKNVLKFAIPTIVMTAFMSFYTMVDGLFVSNLIGTDALSAVNLTAPIIALVTAVSTMLATGGSAVIMKKMGEQKTREAKEDFTFLIIVNVIAGFVMSCLGYLMMDTIFKSLALSPKVFSYCQLYLSRYLIFTIPILLMNNFTLYMIAAGKSALSMVCSIAGGILNMMLDYIFIALLDMGIAGAAIATGLGYSVTAVVGIVMFSNKNCLLHFVKPVYRSKTLLHASTNGSSEMATALVTGIVTMMFNWTMLKYVGENGVAAITIIMYVLMFATSLYTGYSYGVAPMISFYYGEQNHEKLKKLIRMSLKIIGAIAAVTLVVSLAVTQPLVSVFARPDNPVYGLAVTGNRICSFALIVIGFNVFASGMFTALSNGLISAVLAFSRSFVFMVIAMLILPAIYGVTGVWLATPVAEVMAICLSGVMFVKYRKKYQY